MNYLGTIIYIILFCSLNVDASKNLDDYVSVAVNRIVKRSASTNATVISPSLVNRILQKYSEKFGYIFGGDLIAQRKEIIEANIYAYLLVALKTKRDNLSFTTRLNEFALFDANETKHLTGFNPGTANKTLTSPFVMEPPQFVRGNIPTSWDWRDHGAVGPVLNQGICGSCYSFATTGVIYSLYALKTGRKQVFSQQQINDCSQKFGNLGCTGGTMEASYSYIIANGGLGTYDSYPYVAKDTSCKSVPEVFNIDGFTVIPSGDERQMQQALLSTTIAVGIDASLDDFLYYSGGIYDNPQCSRTRLNHAVLLIGYGETSLNGRSQKYWLLQNSWGTQWGENGYFKIPREQGNFCGVASQASYGLKQGVIVSASIVKPEDQVKNNLQQNNGCNSTQGTECSCCTTQGEPKGNLTEI